MNMWALLLPVLGAFATAVWFFIQRRIERKPESEALDIAKRLLEVRKELSSQNLTLADLERFRVELLGVAIELQPRGTTVFTARVVAPKLLISILVTTFFAIELAEGLIRYPTPFLSIQTAFIAWQVVIVSSAALVTVVIGILFVMTLLYGPFRIAA